MTDTPLVLILDDQLLVAFETAALLEHHGFSVLGPFGDIDEALVAIKSTAPDVALLDINLGNAKTSHALADVLLERDVPFAFLTGYGSADVLPVRFNEIRRVTKPAPTDALISLVNALATNR